MTEKVRGWCRLPVTEKKLKEEVERYFERCLQEGTPPTPSGLALALDVRTSTLSDERLSPPQKAVISRAMQRIEANTMEMMLTRGGVKGMENILEKVAENEESMQAREKIRGMSDGEIEERLRKVAEKIERALKEAERQREE